MSSLILDSLEIEGFRAFRHLRIERLGRVNLIVGKNSVGKSSLLEALWLYARGRTSYLDVLAARDEFVRLSSAEKPVSFNSQIAGLRHLFHGRRSLLQRVEPIQIGPANDATRRLTVEPGRLLLEDGGSVQVQLPLVDNGSSEAGVTIVVERMGQEKPSMYPFDTTFSALWSSRSDQTKVHCVFLSAGGLNKEQIGQLWDSIALTDLEQHVLNALQIIDRGVQRVNLVGSQENGERVPIVRTSSSSEPVPLRSLGEGMSRLFGIALALVNAKNGLLLIDEVESGLHYLVQLDMWRLIFAAARNLNVQVFATSHSWDCIEAFQIAAQEDQHEEGVLIRLENRQGEIIPVLFDERQLAIVTREEIEVR